MILWCGAIVMNRHYTPVLPPGGSAGAVLRGGAQQDLSQTAPELIRQTRLHKAEKGRRRERKGRNRFDVCVLQAMFEEVCRYIDRVRIHPTLV